MSRLNDVPDAVPSGSSDAIPNAHESPSSSNTSSVTEPKEHSKTTESTSVVIPETSMIILQRLARQIEYYFSTANLEKDTYVATLRSLNDGYVPLSIIANFGKVKALVPYDALNAVRTAAIDLSEHLEVVRIHTQTGKRVDEETAASLPEAQTVEAVGPTSGEPIPMSEINTLPVSPSVIKPTNTTPVQNTLIIREVPESTEESHIRDLFTFEKCPPIQSLHLDVANCWFVTLDTESKEDMINVMFELRSKKFPSGETVKARLKSAVAVGADVSPVNYGYSPADSSVLFVPQLQGNRQQSGNKKGQGNKKKKNNSSGTNKGKNSVSQNKNAKDGKNNGNTQRRNNSNNNNGPKKQQNNNNKKTNGQRQDGRTDASKAPSQAPPTLGEDQFPALFSDDLGNDKKIEVEKVPEHRPEDDLDKPSSGSDSASTATTTSSSSSSKNASSPIGGYAAALLKAAPPMKPKPAEAKDASAQTSKDSFAKKGEKKVVDSVPKNGAKKNTNQSSRAAESFPMPAVSVQPPSWGGGRSFADVLRKEAAAAVAATPGQSA